MQLERFVLIDSGGQGILVLFCYYSVSYTCGDQIGILS